MIQFSVSIMIQFNFEYLFSRRHNPPMTTHHTDEKKPAQGGIDEQVEARRPMLPSSRRCVWIGPETDQERWAVKNKMEEVLGRIDAMLWALDRPAQEGEAERRIETLRHFITAGMHRALELEALLLERDPKDKPREMETHHFNSLSRR